MNWTYGGNPLTSVSDQVRFLVGDTDNCEPLLSNQEVAYCLAITSQDALGAALMAARALANKFARAVDESVGPVSISFSQRAAGMQGIVADLLSRQGAMIWAGGISRSDVAEVESDTDRIPPLFQRGTLDGPGLRAGDRPRSELSPWDTFNPLVEGNDPT